MGESFDTPNTSLNRHDYLRWLVALPPQLGRWPAVHCSSSTKHRSARHAYAHQQARALYNHAPMPPKPRLASTRQSSPRSGLQRTATQPRRAAQPQPTPPTHPQPPRRPHATPRVRPRPRPPATTTPRVRPRPRPPATTTPPARHRSVVSSASGPSHVCDIKRVVSFCACHHAISSFVRISTKRSNSSSSEVCMADESEWLHWHAPCMAHEHPTTWFSSEAVVSSCAAVTFAEDTVPRKLEPELSAWQAARKDNHIKSDKGILAQGSAG